MRYTMKYKVATAALSAAILFGGMSLPAPIASAAQTQAAEIQWGVNMRTAPSTSGSIIRMIKKGEQVSIIEQANSNWYKVTDSNGKTGYISSASKYTNIIASSGSGNAITPGASTVAFTANAIAKKSVNFRKAPSASAQKIRSIKKNEKVQVITKTNSNWYEVKDANGVTGYVTTQSAYLNVTGTIASTPSNPSNPSNNGSGTSNSGSNSSGSQTSNAKVEKIITVGAKYMGTPYEFGSNRNTTTTFDCSDFMKQIFKEGAGVVLPADSRQQGTYVKNKGNATSDMSKLKRGDLMFFMSYKGSSASAYKGINKSTQRITHVGIYLGDGKILHTYSKESGGVRTDSIKGKHWEHRFLYGGSAL